MIVFYLNGQRVEAAPEQAHWMLADYLRQIRGLTGTKIVCAEGDCGACTVLRLRGKEYLPVNSCILTLGQLAGASLITVDQIGPHPVQTAMVACHGSQCGFCTPGFVMALAALAEKRRPKGQSPGRITPQDAKNATTGNLCRCTGYQPIIDAACAIDLKACAPLSQRFKIPAAKSAAAKPVALDTGDFFAPTRLAAAIAFLKKHPRARVLAGGTDLGVVHNKRKLRFDQTLSLHQIPELREVREAKGKIRVGAQVTLSELREFCKKRVPELARFLDLFASPQIKNAATLAGNVANASPIGDTPPFLLAVNATLHLRGPRGSRRLPVREFFKGYRKTALRPAELILAIEFDRPANEEHLALRKVSQRKDLDISAVSAAFKVKIKSGRITEAAVAYGGVAATPLFLKKTSRALVGPINEANCLRALETLQAEIKPLADLRGSAAYRRVVAENLLQRFLRELAP